MQYYFCSSSPCALKINGEYKGVLGQNPLSFNCQNQLPFIEAYPISNDALGVTAFLLSEEFLNSPPNGVIITQLNNSYLVTFINQTKNLDFKVIAQDKRSFALATLFSQNCYNITIETPNDFYTQQLPLCHIDDVNFHLLYEKVLTVTITGDKNLVLVYNLNDKVTKLFEKQVDSFDVQDYKLVTVEKFCDLAKHTLTCEWQYSNNILSASNRKLECSPSFSADKLCEEILPYAFLEEFNLSGQYLDYLSENVKSNSDKLSAYLGEFIGVCPPLKWDSQDKVGLIYSNGKNKYKVKYAKFELQNRKITNIILED